MPKISKTEDILFEALKNIGLNPERQYPISTHHVDFAFPHEKLVIEVDGWEYHKDRKQREIDEKRRDVAENLGWRVKRFTAEEVYENPIVIAWRIKEMLIDISKKPKNLNFKVGYTKEKNPKQTVNTKYKSLSNSKRKKTRVLISEKLPPYQVIKIRRINLFAFMGIILLLGIIIWYFMSTNHNSVPSTLANNTNQSETSIANKITNSNPPQPEVKPVTVQVSGTSIVVHNSLPQGISINVTYHIYSRWFGIDVIQSYTLEVNAGSEKSFVAYDNIGCASSPCSLTVMDYNYNVVN